MTEEVQCVRCLRVRQVSVMRRLPRVLRDEAPRWECYSRLNCSEVPWPEPEDEDEDEDDEPTSEQIDAWIEHCYGSR